MSLDPVFVAEFANADWLERLPEDDRERRPPTTTSSTGAAETVTWDDGVYAFPQWANTQVLWYRKSLAEAAGLDMTQPVTWDQVIDAAADNGGTVGVQANKYEAYVVLDQRAHPGRRRRHHLRTTRPARTPRSTSTPTPAATPPR